MNYQALGEYTAFKQQAQDAADRRFALLYTLGLKFTGLAKSPTMAVDGKALQEVVQEAEVADLEMNITLNRANATAPLCGEPVLALESLGRR